MAEESALGISCSKNGENVYRPSITFRDIAARCFCRSRRNRSSSMRSEPIDNLGRSSITSKCPFIRASKCWSSLSAAKCSSKVGTISLGEVCHGFCRLETFRNTRARRKANMGRMAKLLTMVIQYPEQGAKTPPHRKECDLRQSQLLSESIECDRQVQPPS